MNKVILAGFVALVMVAFLAISSCYAIDMKNNGYAWNSADNKDKVALCKIIAGQVGKPYNWWLKNLNDMYDCTDDMVLNISIARAAAMITVYQKTLERQGQ